MAKIIRFDPGNQLLLIDGERAQLSPKAFAVLDYLYQHKQQLVTKDDLLSAVWPKVYVTDAVLKVAVGEVRKALNDHPKQPEFIETVHRRGYRFIGELTMGNEAKSVSLSATKPAKFLVGRETLLQQLDQFRQFALNGEKQLVFVRGEAGCGKSALLDNWLEQAVEQGQCMVARAGCFDQHGSSEPYLPVLSALSGLLHGPQQAEIKQQLRQYAPGWYFQLPALIQDEDKAALQQELFGATPQRMLREFVDFIEVLARQKPLLLCIEDLHWCDPASLDLLAALAQRPTLGNLLLVASFRSSALHEENAPLKQVYSQLSLHQQCQTLEVSALSVEEVQQWLQQRLPPVLHDKTYRDLFYRDTGGNPLLLSTALEYLQQSGVLAAGNEVTPEQIEQGISGGLKRLLSLKTAHLQREERQLLEAASVSDAEFSTESLAAVLQKDVLELEEACEGKLSYEQWLTPTGSESWPDGSISESYRFWHQLYRQFFYEALSAARRRHYHLRFAERLLAGYRGQLTALAAQLAYHFESGGDLSRALELRLLASEQAGQRFAYQEAIEHISKALELSQHDEDLATHMAARKKHCHFLLAGGRLPEAIAAYKSWIQVSQQSGEVKHEITATMGLSDVLFWVDRQACLETAKQAVELSKQLSDEKLHIHAQGKYIHFCSVIEGYQPEYAVDYEAALALAKESGDAELQCVHYARYLYYLSIQSRYAEANELALATAQIARDSGDAVSYLSAEFFHAWGLFYQGEWAQMQTVMADALALAEKNAHIPWVLHFRLQQAWLLTQAGEYQQARELCQPIFAQVREQPPNSLYFFSLIILIHLETGAQQTAAATEHVDTLLATLEQRPQSIDWVLKLSLQQGLAEYWLLQQHWDKARQAAEELKAQAACSGEQTYRMLAEYCLARCALGEDQASVAQVHRQLAEGILQEYELPVVAWRVAELAGDEARSVKERRKLLAGL